MGIRTLGLYAIESVFYHSAVIEAVLNAAGSDVSLAEVKQAACRAVPEDRLAHFARDASCKAFRYLVAGRYPVPVEGRAG